VLASIDLKLLSTRGLAEFGQPFLHESTHQTSLPSYNKVAKKGSESQNG